MTIKNTAIIICDACGASQTSLRDQYECGQPVMWADVSWEQLKPGTSEGYNHRNLDFKQLHLCPDHLEKLLKMVAEAHADNVTPVEHSLEG